MARHLGLCPALCAPSTRINKLPQCFSKSASAAQGHLKTEKGPTPSSFHYGLPTALQTLSTSHVRKIEPRLSKLHTCLPSPLHILAPQGLRAPAMPGHRTGIQLGSTALKQTVPRVSGSPQIGMKGTNLNTPKLMTSEYLGTGSVRPTQHFSWP